MTTPAIAPPDLLGDDRRRDGADRRGPRGRARFRSTRSSSAAQTARAAAARRGVRAGAARVAGAAGHRRVQAAVAVARHPARTTTTPAAHARAYATAGAAAISVLTEPTFFDGALEHLRAVRAAVDGAAPAQGLHRLATTSLLEAVGGRRRRGAADRRGARRSATARAAAQDASARGLACLVEVHDTTRTRARRRRRRARRRRQQPQPADARPSTWTCSIARRRCLPAGVTAVAESGIRTTADIERLSARRLSRVPGRRAADHAAGSRRGAAGASGQCEPVRA